MNFSHQTVQENGQSPGYAPKTSKRNSGLFSFFKWLTPTVTRESAAQETLNSRSSSCESLRSVQSNGTVASFSYIPPSAYDGGKINEKCIDVGPETDTYKARLKLREQRREHDKNLTLRKKYNLFFNCDTLFKTVAEKAKDDSTKSLPLMTRTANMERQEEKIHRRTNSESSKVKKAGAYLHVKGKRKAPQPPRTNDTSSTLSLRRKKRLAPAPPSPETRVEENVINKAEKCDPYSIIEDGQVDVICNDSLKLDHGILKSVKKGGSGVIKNSSEQESADSEPVSRSASARSSYTEAPVSPRPWYKRNSNTNRNSITSKKDHKYEPVERLPEVSFVRNSTIDLTVTDDIKIDKKKDEKRKSGITFLTNISELDREAGEIIKKEHQKNGNVAHEGMPEFMRPKPDDSKINTDSWVSPKRRSAKDLIAKFNAITNVTKVTVNSAFFGGSQKDKHDYFGRQISLPESKRSQEVLLERHKRHIDRIDIKLNEDKLPNPIAKSESTSAIKSPKPETPKSERKNWNCPKCNVPNEYWRIICNSCSTIKPYFDDITPTQTNLLPELKVFKDSELKSSNSSALANNTEKCFERSKTQIGFSALAHYNYNKNKLSKTESSQEKSLQVINNKKEEREKLKKMLIEMKNSLPKRKHKALRQSNVTDTIVENSESCTKNIQSVTANKSNVLASNEEQTCDKTQERKVAEIIIGTSETIYENIKIKKVEKSKPVKVSSSAQTKSVLKKTISEANMNELLKNMPKIHKEFELMRPKDFENIYSDSKSAARIYANLARNDELSLFFNVPKTASHNNGEGAANVNAHTIEINRLLRRLETAIGKGDMAEAAVFAKELAQLKVNCSVIRQKPDDQTTVNQKKGLSIEMYVEDKISHRGPFPIQVTEDLTLRQLKQQIEQEFEIPINVQRWILGKELATKDDSTLKDYDITTDGLPVFLYLVAPEKPGSEGNAVSKKDKPIQTNNVPPSASNVGDFNADLKDNSRSMLLSQSTQGSGKVVPLSPKELAPSNTPVIDKNKQISAPKIVSVIPKVVESIAKEQQKLGARPRTEKVTIKQNSIEITPIVIDVGKKAIEHIQVDSPNEHKITEEITIKNTANVNTRLSVNKKEVYNDVKSNKAVTKLEGSIEFNKEVAATGAINKIEIKNIDRRAAELTDNVNTTHANQKIESKLSADDKILKEDDRFDAKTLKPQVDEWQCHLCTLLNPMTSNICAVCATVRLKINIGDRRPVVKKEAPKLEVRTYDKDVKDQTYLQLVNLDNADLVENVEQFECVICFLDVPPGKGVTLRECLHQFCKICLSQTIEYADEAEVKCPYRDDNYSCNIALQDREVKALVTPDIYEKFLAKSVAQAENKIGKSFHCKSPDCKGWCIVEDNVNHFLCPVCCKTNCLTCQAIHTNMNCKQYQERMILESETDENVRRTREMLDEMVDRGEAIACPTCHVILMKKWGCDWLRCSMCKTEICWVTRGARWGPAGKGDTSGGCQCGVNGLKCHPQCNYCH